MSQSPTLPVPAPDEGGACAGCGEPLDPARALYVDGLAHCKRCAQLQLGYWSDAERAAEGMISEDEARAWASLDDPYIDGEQ